MHGYKSSEFCAFNSRFLTRSFEAIVVTAKQQGLVNGERPVNPPPSHPKKHPLIYLTATQLTYVFHTFTTGK